MPRVKFRRQPLGYAEVLDIGARSIIAVGIAAAHSFGKDLPVRLPAWSGFS
ncbi:MAG: hypothetical protein JJU00_19860 [Opitutales bacterium]|nr:hypothetical protein [Opitutales bacterium]